MLILMGVFKKRATIFCRRILSNARKEYYYELVIISQEVWLSQTILIGNIHTIINISTHVYIEIERIRNYIFERNKITLNPGINTT